MRELVLHFPDSSSSPDILDIGEKGLSLFQLSDSGLEVPHGFILTNDFFTPWIEAIEKTPEWEQFSALAPEKMWSDTSISEKIPELILSESQKNIIQGALTRLNSPLVALRPSLADPIIHGNSFADRYETHLAVTPEQVIPLVARIFRSCIDPRIYMIQKKRGLETPRIRIALIVQAQIFSEASGAIYSSHPKSNDYDHAMVESVWGMGDYLADGAVEPDRFTLDKVSGEVTEVSIGSKRVTSWLNFQKEVERRPEWKHSQPSLTKSQLQQILGVLKQAKELYSTPIKLDWALAGGKIYALQVSHFESIIRISSKQQTAPGNPRRIYLNLSSVFFGYQRPLTPASIHFYKHCIDRLVTRLFGNDHLSDHWRQLITCWEGGLFLDVTLLLLHFRREKVLELVAKLDPLAARIIEGMDLSVLPRPQIQCGLFSTGIRILVRNPFLLLKIIGVFLFPKVAYLRMKKEANKLHEKLLSRSLEKMPLDVAARKLAQIYCKAVVRTFLPGYVAAQLSKHYLEKTFEKCAESHWWMRERLRSLGLYHPHASSRVFPLELHYLSRLVQIEQIATESDLVRHLHQESLPPSYKQAWLRLLEKFGKKGAGMAELSSTRFAEEPLQFLPSIFHFIKLSSSTTYPTPQVIFDRTDRVRNSHIQVLTDRAAVQFWPEIFIVQRTSSIALLFACCKDWSETLLYEMTHLMRQRLVETGTLFSTHNRIEKADQIFYLNLSQIDHATSHTQVDLRDMLMQVEIHRSPLPLLIDSRGHILDRNSSLKNANEERGLGIVPGKARGKAHFLESYRPQDFQPGEILVVTSLDPAWAPILVMASAVIVEFGGAWNPGIKMALEYNIPCISGIMDVASQIRSGEWLEVDGEKGTFRKISPPQAVPQAAP